MLIRDKRTGKSIIMFHTRKTGDVNVKQWFVDREKTVGDFEVNYRLFDNGEIEVTKELLKEYNVSRIFAVKRNPYSRAISCWRYMNFEFSLDWSFEDFLSHLEDSAKTWPDEGTSCPLDWKGKRCSQFGCKDFCHFHKHCLTTQMSVIGNKYPVNLLSFENLQEDFDSFMESLGITEDTDFPNELINQPLEWLKKGLEKDRGLSKERLDTIMMGCTMINSEKHVNVLEEIKALQPDLIYDTILTPEQKDRVFALYSEDFKKLGYLR